MYKEDESQTGLGAVKIHKNVIVSVAAIAATEIDGVKSVAKGLKSALCELAGARAAYAIKVDFDKNGEIRLLIPLVIKYGFNIPDVANKVQENVNNALDKMTNLPVRDIKIIVQGIEAVSESKLKEGVK